MRRILLVTRNLPPLVGGMERLNWHMAEELAKVAHLRIVGPEGSAAQAPPNIPVREAVLKPLWKFLLAARRLACREARQWQPDIILAGSGLMAPVVLAASRACGAKTAVYVHGLDLTVKHPVYRALWLPAIRRMDRVIANSRPTANLCTGIGVDSARVGIVHPGADVPQQLPANAALRDAGPRMDDFRVRHQLGSGPLLLSVGRLSSRKGLREFVTCGLPRIVSKVAGVTLVVIGDAPSHALHARAQTPESIRHAATCVGVADNLRFLGQVSDAELEAAFQAADVHVFPVREIPGDPEGFGMVAVEAAAQGLPTVAFASGGIIDAVADGVSGYLVAPGDYPAFADAVVRLLSDFAIGPAVCLDHARRFAWPEFGRQLGAQLLDG